MMNLTLTPFEWTMTTASVALLVSMIAWLLIDKVKRIERDHKTEVAAREGGDSALAVALAKITESLREMSDANIREHGEFARQEAVSSSHRRIYEGIEEIAKTCTRIEAKMVTQEQCHARCVNAS